MRFEAASALKEGVVREFAALSDDAIADIRDYVLAFVGSTSRCVNCCASQP